MEKQGNPQPGAPRHGARLQVNGQNFQIRNNSY